MTATLARTLDCDWDERTPSTPGLCRGLFDPSTTGLSDSITVGHLSSPTDTILWATRLPSNSGPDADSIRAQRRRVRPRLELMPAIVVVPPTSSLTATESTGVWSEDAEEWVEQPETDNFRSAHRLPPRVDCCELEINADQTSALLPFDPTESRRIAGMEVVGGDGFRIRKADVFGNCLRGKGSPVSVRPHKAVAICSPAAAGQYVEYADDLGAPRLGFLPPFVLTNRGRASRTFVAVQAN